MIAPEKLGIFIWQPRMCEGGNWASIISKAKRCGFSYLILHEFFSKEIFDKLHASGLRAGFCFYSVPGVNETASQISRAVAARDAGADFILVDAEIQWELPGWRGPEATVFAKQLRAALGDDMWIGNAGAWQWPESHPAYPDKEFSAVFDAALPERYWVEFSPVTPYAKTIAESERQWENYPDVQGYKSVIPIGSCYGTNGEVPAGHQPLKVEDVADFIGRYSTCALWSWLHVPTFVWQSLELLNSVFPRA